MNFAPRFAGNLSPTKKKKKRRKEEFLADKILLSVSIYPFIVSSKISYRRTNKPRFLLASSKSSRGTRRNFKTGLK